MLIFYELATPTQTTPVAAAKPNTPVATPTTTPVPTTAPATAPAPQAEPQTQTTNSAAGQTPTPSTEQQPDRLSRLAKNVALVGGGIGVGALAHGLFGGDGGDDSGNGSTSAAIGVGGNHQVENNPTEVPKPIPPTTPQNITYKTYNIYSGHHQYDDETPRVFNTHRPQPSTAHYPSLSPGRPSIMIGDGRPNFGRGFYRPTPFDMIHSRTPRIPVPVGYGFIGH